MCGFFSAFTGVIKPELGWTAALGAMGLPRAVSWREREGGKREGREREEREMREREERVGRERGEREGKEE